MNEILSDTQESFVQEQKYMPFPLILSDSTHPLQHPPIPHSQSFRDDYGVQFLF